MALKINQESYMLIVEKIMTKFSSFLYFWDIFFIYKLYTDIFFIRKYYIRLIYFCGDVIKDLLQKAQLNVEDRVNTS